VCDIVCEVMVTLVVRAMPTLFFVSLDGCARKVDADLSKFRNFGSTFCRCKFREFAVNAKMNFYAHLCQQTSAI
jgi:hypothetical protein